MRHPLNRKSGNLSIHGLWLFALLILSAVAPPTASADDLITTENLEISKDNSYVTFKIPLIEGYKANDSSLGQNITYWSKYSFIVFNSKLVCSMGELGMPTGTGTSSSEAVSIYAKAKELLEEYDGKKYETTFKSDYVSVAWGPKLEDTTIYAYITVHLGYIEWQSTKDTYNYFRVTGTKYKNSSSSVDELYFDLTTTDDFDRNWFAEGNSYTRVNKGIKWAINMPDVTDTREWSPEVRLLKDEENWEDYYDKDNRGMKMSDNNLLVIALNNTTGTNIATEGDLADNRKTVSFYEKLNFTKADTQDVGYSGIALDGLNWSHREYTGSATITLPGYPYPTISSLEITDLAAKKVKLTWASNKYDGQVSEKGKWQIFREEKGDASTRILLATLDYSAREYTDNESSTNQKSFGKTYVYTVVFVPDSWTVSSPSDADNLYESAEVQITPFSNIKADDEKTQVHISWNIVSFSDATATNPYTVTLERSTDEKTWTKVTSTLIEKPDVTEGEYYDDGVHAYVQYAYRLSCIINDERVYSDTFYGILAQGFDILSFNASHGQYTGTVKISCEIEKVGTTEYHINIERRPLGNENESAWTKIYTMTSTATEYSYDDQTAAPGSYYEYRLSVWTEVNGNKYGMNRQITDGFCMASGVVSGRIYYDSGTSVPDVKVSLRPNDDDVSSGNMFYSIGLAAGENTGISYEASDDDVDRLLNNDFTMQFYIRPDSLLSQGTRYLLQFADTKLALQTSDSASQLNVIGKNFSKEVGEIASGRWSNIALTYSRSDKKLSAYIINEDGTLTTESWDVDLDQVSGAKTLKLGSPSSDNANDGYSGNIDEFRYYTKALTQDDILKSYNHTLSGLEDGLAIYWPMDEGIVKPKVVYDYSKTNNVLNDRVGRMEVAAVCSTTVPDDNLLSLCSYTDANGNYTVRGIHFTGEGTNYSITPTLGVHSFNPSSLTRFISVNSLVHSGVDFKDESSFAVSGQVFYEGTTIPVADVAIKVDGTVAVKDGEGVKTADDGTFTVSVPIGDHFISLDLADHQFSDGGRYPADPNSLGLRHTFESAISGLTFYDTTKVVIAGRVAGGSAEESKVLGLGQGVANIGQATITLDFAGNDSHYINAATTQNGTSVSYDKSDKQLDYPTTQGKAYVKAGDNAVTIVTDASTGEFAAQVPPLKYTARSIVIPSQTDIDFTKKLPIIDATNASTAYTDSITNANGGLDYFKYNASAKVIYNATPQLNVVQDASGAFGCDKLAVTSLDGKSNDVKLYTKADDGSISYTFGYPVFNQLDPYKLQFSGYERYVNKDGGEGKYVTTDMPLKGAEITVKNELGTSVSVSISDGSIAEMTNDTFSLDSIGRATYTFNAGLPNIQAPYTRSLNISYKYNDTEYSWSENGKFAGIILGALPKGNNFVTKGPDEVLTVIHDPGGSYSSTTFTQGSTITNTKTSSVSVDNEFESTIIAKIGFKSIISVGMLVSVATEISIGTESNLGASLTTKRASGDTTETVTTFSQDVSTSSDPDYVGHNGDVFLGNATNIVIGGASIVQLVKNEVTGEYEIEMVDGLTCGNEYATTFAYSVAYLENEMLPNILKLRNSLLTQVSDINSVARPTDGIIYVTTLSPDDPKYGSSNSDKTIWGDKAVSDYKFDNDGRYVGPSYTIIAPEVRNDCEQDMVNYYNEQYAAWIQCLSDNEKAKVEAIKSGKATNYSLDGGSDITVTNSKTTTTTKFKEKETGIGIIFGTKFLTTINDIGGGMKIKDNCTTTTSSSSADGDGKTSAYSFTLSDNARDNISIDVYDADADHSPIFYTRAGLTSAPFEDQVVTKYYQPGTIISEKTQQIEKPEIEVLDPIITGVPAGKSTSFRVALRNNSEAGRDIYYGLCVVPESNPDGAAIDLDGKNITEGVNILVPYGTTLYKTLNIKQTNQDVLEYKDIKLKFYSTNQPDDTNNFPGIYSTGSVSVYFQPTCSDISLSADTKVVNTESTAPLMLNIRGYDYTMSSLKGVRLQYKGANDANFVTLQEYTKDEEAANANLLLLPALTANSALSYSIDLTQSTFTDQTYVFRAITVCDSGSGEINNESEEVEVVRDMTRPQIISTPTPTSGVLYPNDDISITFAEDIRSGSVSSTENFDVVADLNESTVVHDVALSLSGDSQAKSNATLDLVDNSFAVDLWLNYTADGQIFQHGAEDNGLSVNTVDGKLAINFAGNTFTSTESLPKGKWLYLNISYDNSNDDNHYLSAGYAIDDTSVMLLTNQLTPEYTGNGPVAVGGEGFEGKVSELAIWNSARSLSEAQADMYTSKSSYTTGLRGYWRFNEGHGTTATDLARSRNIVLPSENAWWINGANYSLAFDGSTAADVVVSDISTSTSESYMIEGWMRADNEQDGAATFWSAGNNRLEMRLNRSGALELVTDGTVNRISDTDLRDDQWHHIALNVLHSTNGSATVYVDGQAKRQFSASAVPSFQAEVMTLGAHRTTMAATEANVNTFKYDRFFKGRIDEIRLWKGRLTSEVIDDNRYTRLSPSTDGLIAYFPFETQSLDQYNQTVETGTLADSTGKTAGLTMVAGEDGTTAAEAVYDTANAPALKAAPKLDNVAFNVVASDRRITLTLTEEPYRLEGCDVYITAKNIRDLAGNACDPIKWHVYIQQNVLRWSESDISVSRMQDSEKSTFSVDIENLSSSSEHWQIESLPTWLNVNVSSGTLSPISTGTVKFTIDRSLAIGSYDETIYLRSSLNIATPLHISVLVEGIVPDWTAFPDEYSMNVVGKISVNGNISSDPKDLIAAFDGSKCVGVGSPQYYSRYDAYMVPLTIYGSSTERKALRYKIYDAGTGTTYPIVAASDDKAMTFVADTWTGSFNDPVIFSPEDKIEQNLSQVREGWSWISLYVEPDVNTIAEAFTNDDAAISLIKNSSFTSLYEDGKWGGSLTTLSTNTMYKIHADAPYSYDLTGTPSDPSKVAQTLNYEWNWIGYPCSAANSLNAALADANPQDGDLIKNQTGFSIFTDNEWIGSLSAMNPGDGYNYYSYAKASKTFHFANATSQSAKTARTKAADNVETQAFNNGCESNATMIAVVKDGETIVDNAVITAISDGVIRGYSDSTVGDALHFVTLGCANHSANTFTFNVKVGDDVYLIPQNLTLFADQHIGRTTTPFEIQLANASLVTDVNADSEIARAMLYTPSGILIMDKQEPKAALTAADLRGLPNGVYIQYIVYKNGTNAITKLIH